MDRYGAASPSAAAGGMTRRDFLKKAGLGAAALGVVPGLGWTRKAYANPAIQLDFVVWNYGVDTILSNIRRFEAEYGGQISVNLHDFGWNVYHETMTNRLRSGTGTDIMYNGGDWLPQFAAAGWVVPLEDYFPKLNDYYRERILGFALQDMTYQGKLYGLPYYADLTTLQYNKALAEEHGVDRPPRTWEELLEMALHLKGKGIATPILLEFAQDLPTSLENFTAMVFGRGGELFDENFDPIFEDPNSPGYQQLQWMVDAKHTYGVADWLPHETDVVRAMNTGRHVYTVLYNYNLAALNNPGTSPLAGQFAVALMPGETQETYGFAKFYNMTRGAVERGPEVVDACLKFIEYFGGEHNGEYKVAKVWAVEHGLGFGQIPLFDDPDVRRSMGEWVVVDDLLEQLERARARRQTVWYGVWAEFMRLQMARALAKEVSVGEALQAAAQRARQLKRQFQRVG